MDNFVGVVNVGNFNGNHIVADSVTKRFGKTLSVKTLSHDFVNRFHTKIKRVAGIFGLCLECNDRAAGKVKTETDRTVFEYSVKLIFIAEINTADDNRANKQD